MTAPAEHEYVLRISVRALEASIIDMILSALGCG